MMLQNQNVINMYQFMNININDVKSMIQISIPEIN